MFIVRRTPEQLVYVKMYEAKDKVVIVTGGAAGIGAGIVKAFLEKGAKHVTALDVDTTSGTVLEEELSKMYGPEKIKFHKCDVTTNELNIIYENILNDLGYIDVVVNCAGIMNDSPKAYLKEIDINVSALIKSSFKAFDIMRKDNGGHGGTIINISSIVGLCQAPTVPVYAATKSAVLQFSVSLGKEQHYSRSGVRVLTMCFGCTDTSLFSTVKMASFDDVASKMLADSLKMLPMQTPENAVNGLLHAFEHGESASTWLVTSGRPAEDITENVTKAYQIMSQGVFS